MKTIQVTCINQGCNRTFRIPEFKFNSTIKNNPDKQECNMCKNKNLLAQSTLYSKNPKTKDKPKTYTSKTKTAKKQPKNSSIRKRKNIDKAFDNAWSLLVKLKAGRECEVCRSIKALNSHHIYSRAKKSVRWNTINGICLCVNHHIGVNFSAHKTPVDFNAWLINYKGQDFINDLSYKANQTSHHSEFSKQLILDELNTEIKKLK